MSRSNYDKPFYVDVGTSVVAIRCASNHDIIWDADFVNGTDAMILLMKDACDRMNRESEIFMEKRNQDEPPKPLRNCDRFNNEREMQFAFLAELLTKGINCASLEEYAKWLLAEAKGETDGK